MFYRTLQTDPHQYKKPKSVQRYNLTHCVPSMCLYCIYVLHSPSQLMNWCIKDMKIRCEENSWHILWLERKSHSYLYLHDTSEISLGPTGHIVKKSTANQSVCMSGDLIQILPHFWWRMLLLEFVFSSAKHLSWHSTKALHWQFTHHRQ